MRQIALDTETTGLDPDQGDRLIEIAGTEMEDGIKTGNSFHVLINPMRHIGAEVVKVHGITNEIVADKPVFSAIADEFLAFIDGAQLVIHNKGFDVKFLNAELSRVGKPLIDIDAVVDTLDMARQRFPGSPVNLDALCRRYNIPLTDRRLHSALVDSRLLAEVYLNLTGGRQRVFDLLQDPTAALPLATVAVAAERVPVLFDVPDDLAANHTDFLRQVFCKTAADGTVSNRSLWSSLAHKA